MPGAIDITAEPLTESASPSIPATEGTQAQTDVSSDSGAQDGKANSKEFSGKQSDSTKGGTESAEQEKSSYLDQPSNSQPQKQQKANDEILRQFQSRADISEKKLTDVYKQILKSFPDADIDDYGNIIKKDTVNVNQPKSNEIDFEQLAQEVATGNPEALKQFANYIATATREQTKQELGYESQQKEFIRNEQEVIRKEFPDLFDSSNGELKKDSLLYQETNRVLMERPNLNNPLNVRNAIEIAERRLIKNNFPKIESQIRNDVFKKSIASTANSIEGGGSKGKQNSGDDNIRDYLSEEQIQALQREGEDLKVISKIVKRVRKQGGGIYL